MARKKTSVAPPPAQAPVQMTLYIAQGGPNSVQAVANLEAIRMQHLAADCQIEIVDVLECPERALADGIVVTPSLAKLAPAPAARIVGNLSDTGDVLRALGVEQKAP